MFTLQRCVSSQLLKLLLFTVALALIQQVKICFLKQPAARDCHQDWSCFLKSFSEMVEIKQSGKYFKCFWRSKACACSGRESLISTTYFSLLGKRAWLFTKSKKGTTLHLKNRGLYFVLGLMMYFSLDKCKLIFCAAVEIPTFWILD